MASKQLQHHQLRLVEVRVVLSNGSRLGGCAQAGVRPAVAAGCKDRPPGGAAHAAGARPGGSVKVGKRVGGCRLEEPVQGAAPGRLTLARTRAGPGRAAFQTRGRGRIDSDKRGV